MKCANILEKEINTPTKKKKKKSNCSPMPTNIKYLSDFSLKKIFAN